MEGVGWLQIDGPGDSTLNPCQFAQLYIGRQQLGANSTYLDGSGTLQGVASGAGTQVKNSNITVNQNGSLSNAGTGYPILSQLAGQASTSQLLVAGRGAALNDDPMCSDITTWTTFDGGDGIPTVQSITNGISGTYSIRGIRTAIKSRNFQIDTTKRYRATLWAKTDVSAAANGIMYFRVYQYSANGSLVGYFLYYVNTATQAEGINTLSTAWTQISCDVPYNASAVYGFISVHLNWTGTAGYHEVQDIRFEERIRGPLFENTSLQSASSSDAVRNNQISISGGSISGIGTGNLTLVSNSVINVNNNGSLSNSGTGHLI